MKISVTKETKNGGLLIKKAEEKQMNKLTISCGLIPKNKSSYFQEIKPKLLIKLYEKNKLIGVSGLITRHFFFNSLFLAVDKEYQRKGYGTKLVKEVLKRKKGLVFLTVGLNNHSALKIYGKLGFFKLIPWRKILGVKTNLMAHF